ncbi:hypothetical protein BDV06DRAFT_219010 [Aspergillus oleicola]
MASVPMGEPNTPDYRARSYQLEMFEASLERNIIVAMGTGSGKTHIALLRITWELENADGTKLIWFLAPTVVLCLQQHRIISQHIPTAKTRTLTGLDKVELWTEQAVWDAALDDIQVVVSTPAVLLDAMTHGFVRISRLGLIIFDEAHHCTRNHPANKIMGLFYHPAVREYGTAAAPRILGLTASAAGDLEALRVIEKNLDSTCITPQAHRQELLKHTHRPDLRCVWYTPLVIEGTSSFGPTQRALIEVCRTLKLEDDPYVKKLRAKSSNGAALLKVLESGNTYCNDQLKKFVARVIHIFQELGVWAAEYFIWASTEQLRGRIYDNSFMDLDDDERKYLAEILSQLPTPDLHANSADPADFPISPKFEALISFLLSTDERDFSGLVFVQQRATVAVMAHLLTTHPLTRDRFCTGGFIGMSNSTKRKDVLGDLLTVRMQHDTLYDFRDGRKNLIVATDVLEEGIDVSACSVVVCYDKPPTLKSFVQRRGRARRQHSTYAMVLSTGDDNSVLKKWQIVEKVMEDAYKKDRRKREEARALEDVDEDVHARFRIDSTGAILTADNAMQHLFHFCSTLPRTRGVDTKPEFSFERHEGDMVKGKVTLPSCVIPAVRRATGKSWWKTERAARKEAAFQAYKALHEHGLINDNLLPLTKSREFTMKDLEFLLPASLDVSEQYDPWVDWANAWASPNLQETRITVWHNGEKAHMKLITPAFLPYIEPMNLFWDSEAIYNIELETAEPVSLTAKDLENMRAVTGLYLQAASTKSIDHTGDFIALFGPDVPPDKLTGWRDMYEGHQSAPEVWSNHRSSDLMGIVRNQSRYGELLLFKRWVDQGNGLELECDPYPKRRNLLYPPNFAAKEPTNNEDPIRTCIVPANECIIDKLPAGKAIFSRFIPVILDRVEAALVANKLCSTIFRDIPFTNLKHVITAITMPHAQAPTHYERYEFFGDSVLKFIVASHLYYAFPNWHEGYLTEALHALVQNGRLAKAALQLGLDKFIISRPYRLRKKWHAPLISEKSSVASDSTRAMSRKVLADVVEALIGAAYFDGGHEKARAVIDVFLPDAQLKNIDSPDTDIDTPMSNTDSMSNSDGQTPTRTSNPHLINHALLESAIGYTFKNKTLLLEALTHGSCNHDSSTQSYQRLEFLGDAVLDILIVEIIRSHPRELPQGEMTRVKQALVGGDLLGFLCLEFEWAGPLHISAATDGEMEQVQSSMHLYTYIRHSPATRLLTEIQTPTTTTSAITRHLTLRPSILSSLQSGKRYPYSQLATLHPDKILSDIIESILGAIYIDSGRDLDACRGFIERLGLVDYASRVLDEHVDVLHPVARVSMLLANIASKVWNGGARVIERENDGERNGDGDRDGDEDDEEEQPWKFQMKTTRVTGTGGKEVTMVEEDADLDLNLIPGETDPRSSLVLDAATETSQAHGTKETPSYTCTISLLGLHLGLAEVTVQGCISKEDAEVRAAMATLEALRGEEGVESRKRKKDMGS